MSERTINILIRTSDRPEYFRRCVESIRNQVHTDYRIIVSADSESTAAYVRECGIEPVMVPTYTRNNVDTFPWNLYLNILKLQVKEGFIMFLDDDDFLIDRHSLEIIDENASEDALLVYRMVYPDGRILPDDEFFGKTPFERKHISMQVFCFNSKYKNRVHFDSKRAGDFRFINQMLTHIKTVLWLDSVLVKLSNFGLNGEKKDLNNE